MELCPPTTRAARAADRRSWLAGLAVLCLTLLFAPGARALECGQVGPEGQCVDGQTLIWCADGQLKTATCPAGELCTQHEAFGEGYGCVAIEETDCADIPREGRCTSANHVVWCDDQGRVRNVDCGEDAVCAWDDALEAYDCLPRAGMDTADAGGPSTPPGEDASGADATMGGDAGPGADAASSDEAYETGEDTGPTPDAVPSTDAAGPTPSVGRGGAEPPAVTGGLDEGCGAAPGSSGLTILLALFALAIRRRISA